MLNDVSCEQRQFYYILTCMSFTSSLENLLTFHLVCMCLCVSVMCVCVTVYVMPCYHMCVCMYKYVLCVKEDMCVYVHAICSCV